MSEPRTGLAPEIARDVYEYLRSRRPDWLLCLLIIYRIGWREEADHAD